MHCSEPALGHTPAPSRLTAPPAHGCHSPTAAPKPLPQEGVHRQLEVPVAPWSVPVCVSDLNSDPFHWQLPASAGGSGSLRGVRSTDSAGTHWRAGTTGSAITGSTLPLTAAAAARVSKAQAGSPRSSGLPLVGHCPAAFEFARHWQRAGQQYEALAHLDDGRCKCCDDLGPPPLSVPPPPTREAVAVSESAAPMPAPTEAPAPSTVVTAAAATGAGKAAHRSWEAQQGGGEHESLADFITSELSQTWSLRSRNNPSLPAKLVPTQFDAEQLRILCSLSPWCLPAAAAVKLHPDSLCLRHLRRFDGLAEQQQEQQHQASLQQHQNQRAPFHRLKVISPHENKPVHAWQRTCERMQVSAEKLNELMPASMACAGSLGELPAGWPRGDKQREAIAGDGASPCASTSTSTTRAKKFYRPRKTGTEDQQLGAHSSNPKHSSLLNALKNLPVLQPGHSSGYGMGAQSTICKEKASLQSANLAADAALPGARNLKRLPSGVPTSGSLASARGKRVRVSFSSLDALLAHCLPAQNAALAGIVAKTEHSNTCEREEVAALARIVGRCDSPAGNRLPFKTLESMEVKDESSREALSSLPDLNMCGWERDDGDWRACITDAEDWVVSHPREVPSQQTRRVAIDLNVVPKLARSA